MLARVLGIQQGVRNGKIYGYPRILDFGGIAIPNPLGVDDAGVILVLKAFVAHRAKHHEASATGFMRRCAANQDVRLVTEVVNDLAELEFFARGFADEFHGVSFQMRKLGLVCRLYCLATSKTCCCVPVVLVLR